MNKLKTRIYQLALGRGMQVPSQEMAEFRRFLAKLGYTYWDESRNPAYKLFLG